MKGLIFVFIFSCLTGLGLGLAESKIIRLISDNAPQSSLDSWDLVFDFQRQGSEPYQSFWLTTVILEGIRSDGIELIPELLTEMVEPQIVPVEEYCLGMSGEGLRSACMQDIVQAQQFIERYRDQEQ